MSPAEPMELIAYGSMHDMKMWLLRNEPSQPNNHAPLCNCNSALLMRLVAAQSLKMEGRDDDKG